MARLHSTIVQNAVDQVTISDVKNPTPQTPVFRVLEHPRPGKYIGIQLVLARLHLHTRLSQGSEYEFIVQLFRGSDNALLGGAVFDTTGNAVTTADRETNIAPDHWLLAPDDFLYSLVIAFGPPNTPPTVAELGSFITVVWEQRGPGMIQS